MTANNNIGVVLVGAGSVGRGVFHQITLTPEVTCRVICDIDLDVARSLVPPGEPVSVVESEGALNDALARGDYVLCQNAELAARAPNHQVFFDCSTAIAGAPRSVEAAIQSKKHVIMMNAEADALCGPLFWQWAQDNGVAYTSSDGDQPAVIARLMAEIESYGLQVAMVGNVKGFLDRYMDPKKIIPEADKRGLNHQMCSSYTDGTKLCVEMSIVANAIGGRVHIPGMIGPRMEHAHELHEHFDLARLWSPGEPVVVDYILGARPRGGIYVVGYTEDTYQQRMLNWFPPEIGHGPFYVLTRPYHLIHLETMRTVFEVARRGESLVAPRYGMRSEVVTWAKKDLEAGEVLDGPGGFASYGLIVNRDESDEVGLPILLSKGVRLRRHVPKDQRVNWDDVDTSSIPADVLAAWQAAVRVAS